MPLEAGLLTPGGFAVHRKLPTRGTFPLLTSEQWPVAAFVPVTVAGAVPASHRLPSPSNERLRLFQNGKLLSSRAFFAASEGRYRSTNRFESDHSHQRQISFGIKTSGQLRCCSFARLTSFLPSFRFRTLGEPGSRCKSGAAPATVKGDEDPQAPLRKREGGSEDEPKARRPTERIEAVCLPWGRAARLSASSLFARDDIRNSQLLQSASGNSTRVENWLCCVVNLVF
jgi:hypothetical protein